MTHPPILRSISLILLPITFICCIEAARRPKARSKPTTTIARTNRQGSGIIVDGSQDTDGVCDSSTYQIIYQGSGDNQFLDVVALSDGGAICGGKTSSNGNGNFDAWLVRTDEYGNMLWTKTYGGDGDEYFKRVIPTTDGGFLASGTSKSFGSGNDQALAVKINSQGSVEWSYVLNMSPTIFQRVIQLRDNSYVMLGTIETTGSAAKILVLKISSTGVLQWGKVFSSSMSDYGDCIIQSKDGNLIISGFTGSFNASGEDAYLMKLSSIDGSVVWLRTYASGGDDVMDWIGENSAGELYISMVWGQSGQASIVKTDKDGHVIWDKQYSFPNSLSRGLTLKMTADGGAIIGIWDENLDGGILRIDQNGNPQWVHHYQVTESNVNLQYAVDVLPSDLGYYIGGYTKGNQTPNDVSTLIRTDGKGQPGICDITTVNITVSSLNPVVQDHNWDHIDPLTRWTPANITTHTPSITRKRVCPQCCVSSNTTIDTSICQGNPFTLPDGTTTTRSGIYTVNLQSTTGCDSIITTHLTVNPSYRATDFDSICPNEPYILPDGRIVNQPGNYTSSLSTITGCDSVITTKLTLRSPYYTNLLDSMCEGQTFTLPDGKVVNAPGDYTSSLISENGCDSIIVTKLTLKSSYHTVHQDSICEGQAFTLPDGKVVNTPGDYTSSLTGRNGCDSIIITKLALRGPYHTNRQDSICKGQPYTLPDGKVVNTPGDYTSSLTSENGCDSIIITKLTLRSPYYVKRQDSICRGNAFTLPDGEVVTKEGIYTVTITSPSGCDTLADYLIFVKSPPSLNLGEDTCLIGNQSINLSPGPEFQQYLWQDGSTSTTLTARFPGIYWVTVSNQCGSATDSLIITDDCLSDIFLPTAFSPNSDGTNDIFRILNVHGQKLIHFIVYNRWGSIVFRTTNITSGWNGTYKGKPQPSGGYVYLIRFTDISGEIKTKSGTVLLIR